jgi:hypothetical protein
VQYLSLPHSRKRIEPKNYDQFNTKSNSLLILNKLYPERSYEPPAETSGVSGHDFKSGATWLLVAGIYNQIFSLAQCPVSWHLISSQVEHNLNQTWNYAKSGTPKWLTQLYLNKPVIKVQMVNKQMKWAVTLIAEMSS